MSLKFSEKDDTVIFTVRIVPRASKTEIVGEIDGVLKIRLSAPPVDGAANAELVKFLAKTFDVSKSAVAIITGKTAKNKQMRIENLSSSKFLKIINSTDG